MIYLIHVKFNLTFEISLFINNPFENIDHIYDNIQCNIDWYNENNTQKFLRMKIWRNDKI